MNKLVTILTLFLLLLLLKPSYSTEFVFNVKTWPNLQKAYGFIIGQEETIKKVEEKFPNYLTNQKLKFESKFPDIRTKIEAIIIKNLGQEQLYKIQTKIKAEVEKLLSSIEINTQFRNEFASLLSLRGEGTNISSPVLNVFLSIIYKDNPVMEFFDGYKQRFSTLDHSKAKGIHLDLDLPSSWLGKDGKRPNTLKQWTSQNGYGFEIINLIITKNEVLKCKKSESLLDLITSFFNNSNCEIKEMLKELITDPLFIQEMLAYKDHKIKYKNLSAMELQPLLSLEASGPMERANVELKTYYMNHMLYYKDLVINLNCMVVDELNKPHRLEDKADKMRPLCNQVLNSFALMNIYQ